MLREFSLWFGFHVSRDLRITSLCEQSPSLVSVSSNSMPCVNLQNMIAAGFCHLDQNAPGMDTCVHSEIEKILCISEEKVMKGRTTWPVGLHECICVIAYRVFQKSCARVNAYHSALTPAIRFLLDAVLKGILQSFTYASMKPAFVCSFICFISIYKSKS